MASEKRYNISKLTYTYFCTYQRRTITLYDVKIDNLEDLEHLLDCSVGELTSLSFEA